MPVRSLAVLLRPAADGPELTGALKRGFADEVPYLTFRYQVARTWDLPVEAFLNAGLGLVPLAPLSRVTEGQLAAVVRRMQERIDREAGPEEAGTLWTAADVLMGLRYSRELIDHLLRGVLGMKESVTYQAIVQEGVEIGRQEGKLEEARELLLDLGGERFGTPDPAMKEIISQIADLDRLHRLGRRLAHVSTWQELLATTSPEGSSDLNRGNPAQ